MFSVHTTPKEFKNTAISGDFGFVFEENLGQEIKSFWRSDVVVFEKLRFQNFFRPHKNEKSAFSNSSGLKSVFEKLRFRDGLVWTGRPNRRNKAPFS